VKGRFNPLLSPEAQEVLMAYYQMQRRSGTSSAARTTIRMLQSLIRLAQAHARLMFRGEVIVDDAVAAIEMTEVCRACVRACPRRVAEIIIRTSSSSLWGMCVTRVRALLCALCTCAVFCE
jgi:DNA replicative helicase MCM subunit Mcm2 (Cdc46/Mcm family)